jgi:hypothetical protein
MDQVRFGGSLVAPYAMPGEPPQQTETVIAPEDRRFGGSLIAPYTGTVGVMEPAPEPVIVEDIEDIGDEETPIAEYIGDDETPIVEDINDDETPVEDTLEALMDVQDEHIPDSSNPFHGKGKKRR